MKQTRREFLAIMGVCLAGVLVPLPAVGRGPRRELYTFLVDGRGNIVSMKRVSDHTLDALSYSLQWEVL
jgi:hypothetical protein